MSVDANSRFFESQMGDDFSNNFIPEPEPRTPSPEFIIPFPLSMESQIRKLRLSIENWKELVLKTHSILLWEKQWHPTAIIGATTTVFTLIWLCDPNVLTILSLLGLFATICDYVLPLVLSSIFKSDQWTIQKQKQLDDICANIILYKTKAELFCSSYYRMRVTNPKAYFGLTIIGLAILAWIGGSINNLFLLYLVITLLLLLPGMGYCGMLSKWSQSLQKIFNDLLENAKSKVGHNKKVE